MDYLFLLFAWLLFYFSHSFFALESTKLRAKSFLKKQFRFYRLGYNLGSLILLVAVLFRQFSISNSYFLTPSWLLKSMGFLLLLVGVFIFVKTFMSFNKSEFIGFEQLKNEVKSTPLKLIKTGLYAYVRHPLYTGILLLLLGLLCLFPTFSLLVIFVATIVYLPFGIYLEEEKLMVEFGEEYRTYQKEVKRLIPFVW